MDLGDIAPEMAKWRRCGHIPSGKHTKNYGKSPFLMGKSTISMAIFNSYVKLPEGNGDIIISGYGILIMEILMGKQY
jgi:hypothetical protein